jgi:hypothetical protein
MTKLELLELLEQIEDDAEVYFSYPAGDYWRSIIVKPVSDAQFENVSYSAYHEQLVLEEVSYDDEQHNENIKSVFVLK